MIIITHSQASIGRNRSLSADCADDGADYVRMKWKNIDHCHTVDYCCHARLGDNLLGCHHGTRYPASPNCASHDDYFLYIIKQNR